MVLKLIVPPEMKFNAALSGAAAVVVGAALIGCSADQTKTLDNSSMETKTLNRPTNEKCNSDSVRCKRWTELAIKCEENMARRDEGYMGRLEPWCGQMEAYREQSTGIELSSAPGAYNF